jgi:hypothetical protein
VGTATLLRWSSVVAVACLLNAGGHRGIVIVSSEHGCRCGPAFWDRRYASVANLRFVLPSNILYLNLEVFHPLPQRILHAYTGTAMIYVASHVPPGSACNLAKMLQVSHIEPAMENGN